MESAYSYSPGARMGPAVINDDNKNTCNTHVPAIRQNRRHHQLLGGQYLGWIKDSRVGGINCRFVLSQSLPFPATPSPPLDNIWVMVIVRRLRGNITGTAVCWIVWHNVHSPQHTYMRSSYRSNRLGLSHWDPYAVHRGGCLELYYCNLVEWFWWVSSLIFDDQLVSFSALILLVWSSGL